jgi:hypothetical protein
MPLAMTPALTGALADRIKLAGEGCRAVAPSAAENERPDPKRS